MGKRRGKRRGGRHEVEGPLDSDMAPDADLAAVLAAVGSVADREAEEAAAAAAAASPASSAAAAAAAAAASDGDGAASGGGGGAAGGGGGPRVSRAQKRREKRAAEERAAAEAERAEQLAQLEGPEPPSETERKGLLDVLSPLGLRIESVPADGHCLFRAAAVQLRAESSSSSSSSAVAAAFGEAQAAGPAGGSEADVRALRKRIAAHMRADADSYAAFFDPESLAGAGDALSGRAPPANFGEYCDTIAESACWGGQMELRALAELVHRTVIVYNADAPPLRMGEETAEPDTAPLRFSYHRHLYALGEHYNAVVEQ